MHSQEAALTYESEREMEKAHPGKMYTSTGLTRPLLCFVLYSLSRLFLIPRYSIISA